MWVYVRSESSLYTVGFYDPKGYSHSEGDYASEKEASQRVHYLNGGNQ